METLSNERADKLEKDCYELDSLISELVDVRETLLKIEEECNLTRDEFRKIEAVREQIRKLGFAALNARQDIYNVKTTIC